MSNVCFNSAIYKFFNASIIKPYNKTYFTIIEYTQTENEMILMEEKFDEDGYSKGEVEGLNEYYRRLEPYIKVTDFSKEGILCENVWIIGTSEKLSKYAVLYNDRTIRYIVGKFTTLPTFNYQGEGTYKGVGFLNYITGRKQNEEISSIIYVKEMYEEKTVKLSRLQYFIMLNKLKLINVIPFDLATTNEFILQYVTNHTNGFYMNNTCYYYEEEYNPDFFYKIKMGIRENLDNYFNRCLGLNDNIIAGKNEKGVFYLNQK